MASPLVFSPPVVSQFLTSQMNQQKSHSTSQVGSKGKTVERQTEGQLDQVWSWNLLHSPSQFGSGQELFQMYCPQEETDFCKPVDWQLQKQRAKVPHQEGLETGVGHHGGEGRDCPGHGLIY